MTLSFEQRLAARDVRVSCLSPESKPGWRSSGDSTTRRAGRALVGWLLEASETKVSRSIRFFQLLELFAVVHSWAHNCSRVCFVELVIDSKGG